MHYEDPTISSLARFQDPSQWDGVVRNVPIFVPHRIKDKKDKDLIVDLKRLKKIAQHINDSFKRRGVAVKFQSGHTRPPTETKQEDQPKIHAYGVNARVGRWGPDREIGLLVDMYIRPGHSQYVQELPFRSSEYYPDSDEITAVALLRTDPRLDMGMLIYGGNRIATKTEKSGRVLFYMESYSVDQDLDLTKKPMGDDFDSELDNLDTDDSDLGIDNDLDNDGISDDVDPDFENKADLYMKKKYPHFQKMYEEGCKKYEMAAPSATNGMPGEEDTEGLDDGMEQFGRKGKAKHYESDRRIAKLEAQIKQQKLIAKEKDARDHINQLQYQEHVAIADADKEVKKLMKLPRTDWDSHLEDIRVNYHRAPINGGSPIPQAKGAARQNDYIRAEEQNDFVIYATSKGYDLQKQYGEAEADYIANERPRKKHK